MIRVWAWRESTIQNIVVHLPQVAPGHERVSLAR